MSHRVATGRNVLKIWLLLGLPIAAAVIAGDRLGDLRLAALFGACAVAMIALVYWYAERIAMGMAGARELLPSEAPALRATVDRIALRAGVARPTLYLLPDGFPRALAAGRGAQGGAALAVSTGLLAIASPAEIEGIIAHEIAHLRVRDVLVQTIAVVVAVALLESSRIGGVFERALLAVLAPLAASFEHLVLSPRREFEADRLAADLCGLPHGLADGLLRLEQAMSLGLVAFAASPATEPFYTANPFAEEGIARFFVTHPPLGKRIQRLRELDPEWREQLRVA